MENHEEVHLFCVHNFCMDIYIYILCICIYIYIYISFIFCGGVQPLEVGIVARYRVFVVECMYLFVFDYVMVSIFKTHLLYRFGRCHGNN